MSLVTGSDESHWQQATLAFAQERKAAGDQFAIYKSRDGLHLDPAAGQHYHYFTAVGMAVGSYIFYRSKVDPIDQANGLLAAAEGLHLPFGLWLDYEGASGMDSASDLYAFMSTLDDGTDWTVGIYGARDMLAATIGHDLRFNRFPIWHPEYPAKWADGRGTPVAIATKAGAPWNRTPDIWQFTDSRKGDKGLDRNVCTAETFARITGHHHHQPTPNPKDLDMDESTLRRIVGEEIDKRVNPDGKGSLLVRLRDTIAKIDKRTADIVSGKRPEHDQAKHDALGHG